MDEKENCPYARRRTHWQFFNSLPRAHRVTKGKLVIDGCIDVQRNMLIQGLLRQPKTIYLVMVRNYADMIWSSYNFWCRREYDGLDCDSTRWVRGHYRRSPQLFHEMVLKDVNGTLGKIDSPLHPPLNRPCANAGGYYSEFLDLWLWKYIPRNATLVIASEELEAHPEEIWHRVARLVGITSPPSSPSSTADWQLIGEGGGEEGKGEGEGGGGNFSLGNFASMRFNAQDHKGTTMHTPIEHYRPGVFAISNFQPLLPETRALLDKCWGDDCFLSSQASAHLYPACQNATARVLSSGRWKSPDEVYASHIHSALYLEPAAAAAAPAPAPAALAHPG